MQPFDSARHARERRRLLRALLALAATLARTTPAIAKEPSEDAATANAPRPANTIEEVRINGVKKTEPTAPRDSMRGREIRQVPGAFGDAFRALEALPGVTPITSGLPYFFVRGAPPGNTGYFIDGVRVPGLFHLGVGPAVVYPALIDRVDLYKSAYPVSFGRFAGGILSADTVPPAQRGRLDWTLRLFDVGALAEAPFGRQEGGPPRGSVLVSGRYGYPGPILSALSPEVSLAYWDYQSRATYHLSRDDVVSVFAFGSYDSIRARQVEDDPEAPDFRDVLNVHFHRVDLRWDRRLSPTGALRAAVTLGTDRTGSETFTARSHLVGTRVLAKERLAEGVHLRAGADAWVYSYDFRVADTRNDNLEIDRTSSNAGRQKDLEMAAWVDAPLDLAKRVHVTPGLRADVFTSRGVGNARGIAALDPRITTRIGLGPVDHIAAIGIAHQPSTVPLPIPALTFAQLRRGLQTGYHTSQGLEVPLPWSLTATATGYLHTYTGLVDLTAPCEEEDGEPGCRQSLTRGRSVGLELMLKRSFGGRIGGWIAYTLSRTTRDAWDPIERRRTTVLGQLDRTHVFNAVLSVDLGKGWRSGGRYTAYSGVPYSTTAHGGLPDARTPPFHRVDLRLEKRWTWGEGRSLAFTAEMFNVLFMKESVGLTCSSYDGCRPEEIGPIVIPSIGCEGTL